MLPVGYASHTGISSDQKENKVKKLTLTLVQANREIASQLCLLFCLGGTPVLFAHRFEKNN
jgi:hypothetical protein